MHDRRSLIIFTRYPEPGKTKKRLIPALGPEGAAQLQREMTVHTLGWAKALMREQAVAVEVRFEGGDQRRMQACFGNALPYRAQGEGDLGRRMADAFESAFRAGSRRAVIIGSDCPELSAELVRTAWDHLADHDLVLGPATDGGYYLIALRREVPALFAEMPWGTSDVLRRTLQTARRLGLSVAQLPPLADVDRGEDLPLWNRVKGSVATEPQKAEQISVIIPTFNENEAAGLAATLAALRSADTCLEGGVETLVAAAGSCDETAAIARTHAARVLHLRPGRGRQMNQAAAAATGAILLFLHADTRLPEAFDDHVRRILAEPRVIAGAFRLGIEGARGSLRLIQWVANLRARYLQFPYGDQALFMRREVFDSLGGFPELPIMEDYELVRRLRRRGRIEIAQAGVVTSARRWSALGPWRTTWINQMIVLGYRLGVSPERLACWYRHGESR